LLHDVCVIAWLISPGLFAGQPADVTIDAGTSASAGSTKGTGGWYRGMAMITLAKGGLMYEASIGGQKFNFRPIDSEQS
jgi:hypothetical protein